MSPAARMPRTDADWPTTIWAPRARMKPDRTGWLTKFTDEPQPQQPHGDQQDSGEHGQGDGGPEVFGVPGAATCDTAVAVMRQIAATGPTASVRAVPKIVYITSGAIEA